MDHWHHFAYLFGKAQVIPALRRLSPCIRKLHVMPKDVRATSPDLSIEPPVLCVDVARLDEPPDDLRAELASVDCTPFDAFIAENLSDGYFDDAWRLDEQARVRAMIWLSCQADAPVGYWFHAGRNGLVADHFMGFGSSVSMWSNEREWQGSGWDESKPRGAYTAALWHIGARVWNVDEAPSNEFAFDWPRIDVQELSEGAMSSLAARTRNNASRFSIANAALVLQHNPPMQRTGAAGIGSFVRKLLGRRPGR